MDLRDHDLRSYEISARLTSIRAAYKRTDPFSEEFERLLEKDKELQKKQQALNVERLRYRLQQAHED